MAKKKATKSAVKTSSGLERLMKNPNGAKTLGQLSEAEQKAFHESLAKAVDTASSQAKNMLLEPARELTHWYNVELPDWLESLGLPRDLVLASQVALNELGEFMLPEDIDNIQTDRLINAVKVAVAKKRFQLSVAAQMKRKPSSGMADQTRDDDPSDADLLIGHQVLSEMATRNPTVEKYRAALRATGLRGSNAKLGKVLSQLKAEKKMPK